MRNRESGRWGAGWGRGVALGMALGMAWAAGAGGAERAGAWLSIDGGGAWVREAFRFGAEDGREVREVRWEGVPDGVDWSSLGVWNVRRPWAVRGWRREGRDAVAELAEPLATGMGYSLTYRVRGVWADVDEETGVAQVRNACGRAFPGARIAVADTGEPRREKDGVGRIDANPAAALSSLWTGGEPVRRAGTWREGTEPVDVPAEGVAEVPLAREEPRGDGGGP